MSSTNLMASLTTTFIVTATYYVNYLLVSQMIIMGEDFTNISKIDPKIIAIILNG